MIDFTNLPTRRKSYGGANGNKLCVVIDGELFMLKLPSHATKNPNLSYANSCISEYLGSHIFSMLGLEAQQTILGSFTYKGVERIAVACKDFEKDGFKLMDFASVKNQIIDSRSNGYGTDIEDVLETIEKQNLIDSVVLSSYFWDVFVVDALIGNWDRHNGNWGFLYNQETDEVRLAPIFDCGSCLFPQMDDDLVRKVMSDKKLFDARVYDFPTSAILKNGKRINYYDFIKSHEYKGCDNAISRIKEKIDLKEIETMIKNIECLSDTHKEFLVRVIGERYKAFFC